MKKGFSLIESIIVLGIVGFVLGGIWIAAGSVNDHVKMNRLQTQTGMLNQKINKVFQLNQSYFYTEITSMLASSNLAPSDMISGSNLVDPWGQVVRVGINTDMSFGDPTFVTISIKAKSAETCSLVARVFVRYAVAIDKICSSNPLIKKSELQYPANGDVFYGGNGPILPITRATNLPLAISGALKTSCPSSGNTINLTIPIC